MPNKPSHGAVREEGVNLALNLPTLFLKGQVKPHFLSCTTCKISHCVLKTNPVSKFSFPRNHTALKITGSDIRATWIRILVLAVT